MGAVGDYRQPQSWSGTLCVLSYHREGADVATKANWHQEAPSFWRRFCCQPHGPSSVTRTPPLRKTAATSHEGRAAPSALPCCGDDAAVDLKDHTAL